MNVLVTGASGFIAHHVIRACQKRKWFVIGVDKRPVPGGHARPDHFIQTDVKDLGFRDLMGVDYVIDLAFSTNIPNSVRHPRETTHENICSVVHLLEVAKEADIKKFIFPSTASLYGTNSTPWNETLEPQPIEPYSWQKLADEYACKLYAANGLPTVVFRLFQVFGEFQRDDTVLAIFMKAKREGRPVTLTQTIAQSTFRSGQRDFIYAGDIAEVFCLAAESNKVGKGEVINLCTGKVRTMEEVADALGAEITWIAKRAYEVERHEGNPAKVKGLFGWEAKVDVIEWLKALQ